MTKIMLVEDDKSLREIYGVRLLAEGYDIVSAGDGEEALAMAIKERPELIISDVMMPKVSGYDMLDILRSTTETRNIKVIMMTALSSEEQRKRGESLGADRYLVKSQVGIEDVVHVVREVLTGISTPPTAPPVAATPTSQAPQVTPAQAPAQAPTPAPAPVTQTQTSPTQTEATPQAPNLSTPPVSAPSETPVVPPQPSPRPAPVAPSTDTPKPPSLKSRVIQPINDPNVATVNMKELLDKELAKEAGITDDVLPQISTTEQEKAFLNNQIAAYENTQDTNPSSSVPPFNPDSIAMPTPNISLPSTSEQPATPPAQPPTTPQTPPTQTPPTPPTPPVA